MKAVTVTAPGGLDRLKVVDLRDPGAPQAGEIRVRLHANSINFHDYAVARGFIPSADGRILLAEGKPRAAVVCASDTRSHHMVRALQQPINCASGWTNRAESDHPAHETAEQ